MHYERRHYVNNKHPQQWWLQDIILWGLILYLKKCQGTKTSLFSHSLAFLYMEQWSIFHFVGAIWGNNFSVWGKVIYSHGCKSLFETGGA